ncbi:MAG: NAD(P)H-dependent glycerol-3-phosphate dehydrogenase [Acidiphilium sp.]|nr:NAD(P)H-dependent glycerol-3-phosphate dehydrogenase [Acidiphilium sp.]
MTPPTLAVIGTGAWGTALAITYARAGHHVTLVARTAAQADHLARTRDNPHLPGIALPPALRVTAEIPPAPILLLCPPFQHLGTTLARIPPGNATLVLCCKGVDRATLRFGPEIAAAAHPAAHAAAQIALLTGPNFAHEIAAGHPAAGVLAMADPHARHALIAQLATPRFRLYGSPDLIGAALGGAAKNVIAIAAGAVIGAGLGENARAALVTRGLAEIARLAVALGGSAETIAGLAGLGDLILTATGQSSRNFRAGLALGHGQRPDPATGIIEGLDTAPALLARAHTAGCDMPVTATVVELLAGTIGLNDAIERLMRRGLRDEGQ